MVLATQPLYVVAVRSMAQFEGGKAKYDAGEDNGDDDGKADPVKEEPKDTDANDGDEASKAADGNQEEEKAETVEEVQVRRLQLRDKRQSLQVTVISEFIQFELNRNGNITGSC